MTDEEPEMREALVKLGVGPAAAELYKDLLSETARELGSNLHAVAKLISAAMGPLHGLVWGIDRVKDWLSVALLKRLAVVPPENIQPPSSHVAGQLLLQLSFCADEERLRELYANLLAASMNKTTASTVHPAFVHVIQQLSPDEALVLKFAASNPKALTLQEEYSDQYYGRTVNSISSQFRALTEIAGASRPEQSDDYLDNLIRLRVLVDTPYTEGELHGGRIAFDAPDAFLENKTGRVVEPSSFGERFLSTCVQMPRK